MHELMLAVNLISVSTYVYVHIYATTDTLDGDALQ